MKILSWTLFAKLLILTLLLTALPFETVGAEDSTPAPVASPEIRFGLLPTNPEYGGFFSDVIVNAGETVDLSVSILNIAEEPIALRSFVANAHNSLNGGFLAGTIDETLTEPALWIDFPYVEAEFPAQSQTDYPFQVTVPDHTEPGQYIAGLVVETAEPMPIPGSDMFDHHLRYSISVGILVPGDISTSFALGDPFLDRGFLAIPVVNDGNYLVRPTGELTLSDSDGNLIIFHQVEMGSVYAGYESAIYLDLPEQIPAGDYRIDLTLEDSESGASASLDSTLFTIAEPEELTGVELGETSIEPNGDPIAFLNLDITLNNHGPLIPTTRAVLIVRLDDNALEEFPLATNQTLVPGENTYQSRYIPMETWSSGTYSFSIVLYATDRTGASEIELLNEPLDTVIVVP